MKTEDLEVKFEPFELPKDYKFVYKIKGCEHKVDFGTNTIVDKILSARTKKVDEEVIRQLRNIGEEKGINELILIDESKVLKMIKSLKALNEILALHDKWLGNEMSDFEFFTLLSEARDKYGLENEVLL